MKKSFLALVLGGALAVGSFLQAPVTVQAADDEDDLVSQGWQDWADKLDCSGLSDGHIKSSNVTLVNGYLTVTLQAEFAHKQAEFGGVVFVCEEQWQSTAGIGDEGTDYYNWLILESNATAEKYFHECDGGNFDGDGEFTLTFDGIASGKTYYVYCTVGDTHGIENYGAHWAVYLGSATPTASSGGSSGSNSSGSSSSGGASSGSTSSGGSSSGSSSQSGWDTFENEVSDQIKTAETGSTVVMDEGVNTLSNAMMRQLLEKGDVSLRLEFTYGDKDYVIIIPAGEALDNDIPWYGPLYLAARYGNSLDNAASVAGSAYEVKAGDSLSAIASRYNMTLKELLAKNPQIKDPDMIRIGQKINR